MEELQLALPERILGRRVVAAEATAAGHTTAWRGRVTLEDGRTVFVKWAKAEAAASLRREATVLEAFTARPSPRGYWTGRMPSRRRW